MAQKRDNKSDTKQIVCFAGCDWWYFNRGLFCPQILRRLAEKGYKVLFINNLGMRIPSLKKDRDAIKKIMRKLRSMLRFIKKDKSGMYVFSPISIPLYGSKLGKKLNMFSVEMQIKLTMKALGFKKPLYYINCPPAIEIARNLGCEKYIYERTDLFEAQPGVNKSYIMSLDDELMTNADLALYVNTAMWKKGLEKNKNSMLIGHGVDYDMFSKAHKIETVPEDIASIPGPKIGFFGVIHDKTSDMELLEYIAKALPDMSLVLVGPISTDVSRLREYKNVYFLGKKPYNEVALYGKEFDVSIMPWNKSKWIEHCNPVKIKEYLALGKPIVSTYYPEIEPYKDVVYIADDYQEFVACIRTALKEQDAGMVERRRILVENETWDSKVDAIDRFIENNIF